MGHGGAIRGFTMRHRRIIGSGLWVGLILWLVGCAGEEAPEAVSADEVLPATVDRRADAPESTDLGGTTRPDPTVAADRPAADLESYAALLGETVTPDGLVRYRLLAEPGRRDRLEAVVGYFAEAALPPGPEQRLALWCNAYNANVLRAVVHEREQADFSSVIDVPGFFDARQITVAGEGMTLIELENLRIRPMGDPRTHGALVRGGMSCPPLRSEPYAGPRLDEQLDEQCRRWVAEPRTCRIVDDEIGLSEVMKWHSEDFQAMPFGSVPGFVLAYADPAGAVARYIVNSDHLRIRWLDYDWTVNEASGEEISCASNVDRVVEPTP